MSPTLKQYAIALYESLKNEKEIDKKILNFVKVLKK